MKRNPVTSTAFDNGYEAEGADASDGAGAATTGAASFATGAGVALAALRGALYRSMLTKVASKTVATSTPVNHPREPVFSRLGRSTRIFESPASSSEFSAGGSAGPGNVMRGPGSGRMIRTGGDAGRIRLPMAEKS